MRTFLKIYNLFLISLLILIGAFAVFGYFDNKKQNKIIKEDIVKVVDSIFNNPASLPKGTSFKLNEGQTTYLISIIHGEFFITEQNGKLMLFFYKKVLEENKWYCLGSPIGLVPEYCKDPNTNEVPYQL